MSLLEFTEIVLVFCNIIKNNYQQNSTVLCASFPNKLFDQFLDILKKKVYFSKKLLTKRIYIFKYGLLIKFLNN